MLPVWCVICAGRGPSLTGTADVTQPSWIHQLNRCLIARSECHTSQHHPSQPVMGGVLSCAEPSISRNLLTSRLLEVVGWLYWSRREEDFA